MINVKDHLCMPYTQLDLLNCYSENALKDTYSAPKHSRKQFPGDLERMSCPCSKLESSPAAFVPIKSYFTCLPDMKNLEEIILFLFAVSPYVFEGYYPTSRKCSNLKRSILGPSMFSYQMCFHNYFITIVRSVSQ